MLFFYHREISLAVMLMQNSKTNMTKNRDKIVNCDIPEKLRIGNFCNIAHP